MGIFNNLTKFNKRKSGGLADVIRCDQTDFLIFKWHPDKYEEGDLRRENQLRTNSILRVKNGQVAVFFYKKNDGTLQDFIEGPYDDKIKTKNLPVLSSILGQFYEGDTPFQAEIYFINTSGAMQIEYAVPYFDVVDPRYPDFQVPIAVRGKITFKIEDYRKFIELHQLSTFSVEDLKTKIIDVVCRFVKSVVCNAPIENNIPVISIETKIDPICNAIENSIKEKISENFGIKLGEFDINAIDIDKSSESYLELKKITKEIVTKQAEINVENYKEELRINREAKSMSTKQSNLGAYQTEVSGDIGVASAQALGKMGENGVGNVNLSNSSFNPVSMMAGMAVGSVAAQNLGSNLSNSMNSKVTVPPNIPESLFYVAVNEKATGPYNKSQIVEMINDGRINKDSLIWKQGTPDWASAITFVEFSNCFPPEIK